MGLWAVPPLKGFPAGYQVWVRHPYRRLRLPRPVARVALGFTVVGLLLAAAGLVLAYALNDRYLGFALLIVGAFLMILPHTRPHIDE